MHDKDKLGLAKPGGRVRSGAVQMTLFTTNAKRTRTCAMPRPVAVRIQAHAWAVRGGMERC